MCVFDLCEVLMDVFVMGDVSLSHPYLLPLLLSWLVPPKLKCSIRDFVLSNFADAQIGF